MINTILYCLSGIRNLSPVGDLNVLLPNMNSFLAEFFSTCFCMSCYYFSAITFINCFSGNNLELNCIIVKDRTVFYFSEFVFLLMEPA